MISADCLALCALAILTTFEIHPDVLLSHFHLSILHDSILQFYIKFDIDSFKIKNRVAWLKKQKVDILAIPQMSVRYTQFINQLIVLRTPYSHEPIDCIK